MNHTTTQDKNQTTTQDKNECYECGCASPRLRVRNNTGPQDCCEEQERPPQTLICDECDEEEDEEKEEGGKNWYVVEVEIDYKYYGHFAVYAKSGEDAEDEIGASDLGLGDRRYDTLSIYGSRYDGDVSEFDTDKFHEIEMPRRL